MFKCMPLSEYCCLLHHTPSLYCAVTGLQSGFTALHVAARYGNHRVAGVLIEFGADVNFVAKVRTCYHTSSVAKVFGKTEAVSSFAMWNALGF